VAEEIDILLSTFNGGRWVAQQLDSILAQTVTGWRLLVRDDGSTDDTRRIVGEYAARHPERIVPMADDGERLGSCRSFGRLLEASRARYTMFCDQDDVWLPHKIGVTLRAMQDLEARWGAETPAAVFTDLKVVDEDLVERAGSFWRLLRLDPLNCRRLNRLVLQSVANGCTMLLNAALRDRAGPIPAEAAMHDWWVTLVAAAFGRCGHVPEPTVLYRQHGANVSGAERRGPLRLALDLCDPATRRSAAERRSRALRAAQRQVEAFLRRYEASLPFATQVMLRAFLGYDRRGFFMRRYLALRHGFLYGSTLDNAGMLLFR
jgi:hypothetical protein